MNEEYDVMVKLKSFCKNNGYILLNAYRVPLGKQFLYHIELEPKSSNYPKIVFDDISKGRYIKIDQEISFDDMTEFENGLKGAKNIISEINKNYLDLLPIKN